MTNLLQCVTFPGIIHKFLDYLFASSKKNALFACVDSTLFHLYIYIYRWVQVTPGVTLTKLHIFYTVDS